MLCRSLSFSSGLAGCTRLSLLASFGARLAGRTPDCLAGAGRGRDIYIDIVHIHVDNITLTMVDVRSGALFESCIGTLAGSASSGHQSLSRRAHGRRRHALEMSTSRHRHDSEDHAPTPQGEGEWVSMKNIFAELWRRGR